MPDVQFQARFENSPVGAPRRTDCMSLSNQFQSLLFSSSTFSPTRPPAAPQFCLVGGFVFTSKQSTNRRGRHQGGQRSPGRRHRRSAGLRSLLFLAAGGLGTVKRLKPNQLLRGDPFVAYTPRRERMAGQGRANLGDCPGVETSSFMRTLLIGTYLF